ncbi:MAG: sigma-54-dependent Fis family transcriptional regulator [Ignavibacteriae bacterium]|nr:sigma-54-dependent Fis family transcriptional regulator [Ignavibacteriota bacterium]
MPSHNILIVEDDQEQRALILQIVSTPNRCVDIAADGTAAINCINRKPYDLVLLDLGLPHVSGMEVLAHMKSYANSTPVIIITGSRDVKVAVEAMKRGAYDYLTKPFGADEITLAVKRALEFQVLRNSVKLVERLREHLMDEECIVGTSSVWLAVLDKARQYAQSDSLVYIEGETGSGKEVIAKYIHRCSARRDEPFVVIDCGVIPDPLIEAELFGYKKGAFTGADSAKEGLVELANGGTLFLDEIGHIDLRFQQKLLKFVETKSFRRIGDTQERIVDVRIIAATNKDLTKESEAGRFRSDLWYRLNVMKLYVPSLRERADDIPLLAEHFLKKSRHYRNVKVLAPEALEALQQYSWPGNVRELQSIIERAIVISSSDEVIRLSDLEIEPLRYSSFGESLDRSVSLMSLREAEQRHIVQVLTTVNWNISRAAKILKIGRTTLYDKMETYLIRPPAP